MTDLEWTKQKATEAYRRIKQSLMRAEKKQFETPTREMSDLVVELRGEMAGIRRVLSLIEVRANSQELPFGQELPFA